MGTVGREKVAHAAKAPKDKLLDGPEGIKYRDIEEGDGPLVLGSDVPKVSYVIKLTDSGAEVKTRNGVPFQPGKNKVIKGLELAVMGGSAMKAMSVGGTRNVIIPASLGY